MAQEENTKKTKTKKKDPQKKSDQAQKSKPPVSAEEWSQMSVDEKRDFLQKQGAKIHKDEAEKGRLYAERLWAKVDVMTRYTHTEFLKHFVSVANSTGVPKVQRKNIKKQLLKKYGLVEKDGIVVQQELKHEPGAKVYQTQGIPELTQDYLDTLNDKNEVDEEAKEKFIKKYEDQYIGYERRLDAGNEKPSENGGSDDGNAGSGEGTDKKSDTGRKKENAKGGNRSSNNGVRKGKSSTSKVQKAKSTVGGNKGAGKTSKKSVRPKASNDDNKKARSTK